MKMKKYHKLHMVGNSPWPLITSLAAFSTAFSLSLALYNKTMTMTLMSLSSLILSSSQWWRDVNRESSMLGEHTKKVVKGLKMGFILFITSEIMFFASIFFAMYSASQISSLTLNYLWPPMGIICFNYMDIPLLNTIVLLSSGASITWSHHLYMMKIYNNSKTMMMLTVSLGVYFSILQSVEYWEANFSMSDSIYGSTFFMATGFHGLHVIVGAIFLTYSTIYIMNLSNSPAHFFGMEAAIWYWHFVDVVWLGVFYSFYYWNNFLHLSIPPSI